jgi:hypothetical protein
MRALTLTQPWAGLVASGVKLVENRPRAAPHTMFGQRFAIHASREIERRAWSGVIEIEPRVALDHPGPMAFAGRVHQLASITSAVIAVATLDGMVFDKTGMLYNDIGRELGEQFKWWIPSQFGYVLRDVIALPRPVSCKGMLGFWTLAPETERAVVEQLA